MNSKSNQNVTPTNGKQSNLGAFFSKHKKILTISVASLISLGFVGSVVYSVFSGGELLTVEEDAEKVKGLIRLESPNYVTSYFENDPFVFDKEKNHVMLVAKDPLLENIVQINDLPAPEYGFIVSKTVDQDGNVIDENAKPTTPEEPSKEENPESGEETPEGENETLEGETGTPEEKPVYTTTESEFYANASDIIMKKDMGNIYLVSKVYKDLRLPLTTTVVGNLDESKLAAEKTFEAELARVYQDDKLLTQENLQTAPAEDKPFLSNYGTSPIVGEDAEKLSGGVCLRNFNDRNMKVEVDVVSSISQEVDLTIKVCKRPKAASFDSSFVFTVNGQGYSDLDSQIIEAGTGYYQPFVLQPVKVKLNRGVNHLVFNSGSKAGTQSPVNLDALIINAADATIGSDDSVIPLN